MSARQTLDAVRYGKARGARVTCEVTPHHFVLTDEMLGAPRALRHQRQDEPAAARDGRSRRDAARGSPTAASTSIATDHAPHHYDEKQVEFDQAPFGITGLETAVSLCFDRLVHPGVDHAVAAGRAAVGESGADSAACPADRWRKARRPTSRSSRPICAVTVVGGADAIEVEEHAVRRLAAARRRRRDDRRRPRRST